MLETISLWPLRHATELHTPPHFTLQLSLPLPSGLSFCLSVLLLSAFILPLTRLCRMRNREKLAILSPSSLSFALKACLCGCVSSSCLWTQLQHFSSADIWNLTDPIHGVPALSALSPRQCHITQREQARDGRRERGGSQESSSVNAGRRQLGLRAEGTFNRAAVHQLPSALSSCSKMIWNYRAS